MPDRPLLLLDIDGPLNPYRAKEVPPGYEFHEIQEGTPEARWTQSAMTVALTW